MLVSILIPSFKRPELLDLGLWSLSNQITRFEYEILVLNDGIEDDTEAVCRQYKVKYIFTGQRNTSEVKPRVPGFAYNIGIKQCNSDIVILTSPEIFHLNTNNLNYIITPLLKNDKLMTIPDYINFDDAGEFLKYLALLKVLNVPKHIFETFNKEHRKGLDARRMPFFLGVHRKHLLAVGGYDEDFLGYAGEDSDLIHRLVKYGLRHIKTNTKIVHLYHFGTNNGQLHFGNREWEYNWNIYQSRLGLIVRNKDRDWGKI